MNKSRMVNPKFRIEKMELAHEVNARCPCCGQLICENLIYQYGPVISPDIEKGKRIVYCSDFFLGAMANMAEYLGEVQEISFHEFTCVMKKYWSDFVEAPF